MAQWRLTKTLFSTRHNQMWSFLREIPERLARSVSACMGREAQANVMYRGSASSTNSTHAYGSARGVYPLFLCLIGIGTLHPVIVVFAAERCPAIAATRVVSVQGNVTWSLTNNTTLQAAKFNDTLCVGDTVRVGAKSRAVLRLPNETTVPLDQNTIFRLKQSISEKEPTLIELIQGAIHVITRTPKPFKVDTPYLNATVEGTEFYVGVDSTEARVAVIEGKVNVSNELGALLLVDNEAATAKKGQAPQRTLTIKPRDAVHWALYYPPLFDPRSRSGGRNLWASYDLYSQGKITDAIESLNTIPEVERNGDFYTYRAGLLLLVGRADEAEPDIETALKENGNNTDALSLKAIIAIVQNDKARALELANQAVNIDDKSASARIALSYALQANFKIEEALKAARQATERDANNALAWARVAELELSIPNYDKSKVAAERAVKLNPNLARTQSVLGFANLTRIDIKAAKESFNNAIELDQADPLPRLGLGLATIRDGNLELGRQQVEIAASLDPENSLIRSYLGKTYYEEKRDGLAATQFDLAKERDPRDPTPYFYNAILNQSQNSPVEALKEVQKSIEENNSRAVYRSTFLLDDDAAARGASASALFASLGFEKLAVVESTKALNENYENSSAHRLLAGAYANLPRHDIARVSEALQSQIRQPLTINAVDPQVNTDNLAITRDTGPSRVGTNEYNFLFNRNRARLLFDGIAGSRGTRGDQFQISGLFDKASITFSQLHYQTDGFLENDTAEKDIYDLFFQAQMSWHSSLQLDVKRSKFKIGETFFRFDPDFLLPATISERSQSYRVNGHHAFKASSNWIWSAAYEDRFRLAKSFPDDTAITDTDAKARTAELQHTGVWGPFQVVSGLGYIDDRRDFQMEDVIVKSRAANAYAYGQWTAVKYRLTAHMGLAAEWYKREHTDFSNAITRDRVSPKLGIMWSPRDGTRLRLAAFSSVRRPFIGSQTIEPTQVVGFNQFFTGFEQLYGDVEGTVSRRVGIAFDQTLSPTTFAGVELTKRKLDVPSINLDRDFIWRESTGQVYLYKVFSRVAEEGPLARWRAAASLEGEYEKIERPQILTGSEGIMSLKTVRVPIGLRLFSDRGLSVRVATTYVKQTGKFSLDLGFDSFDKADSAWISDVAIDYRLPKRLGVFSIGIKNISDRFIDLVETDPLNPRIATRRLSFLKLSLAF